MDGSTFKQKTNKNREKYMYCRLSTNHKFFHYDDCEEKAIPSIDELKNKVAIADIKTLVTGKDCPHFKDKERLV